MRHKQLEARLRKEEDTHAVQSRIIENQKLLEDLEQISLKTSKVSMNPE